MCGRETEKFLPRAQAAWSRLAGRLPGNVSAGATGREASNRTTPATPLPPATATGTRGCRGPSSSLRVPLFFF